nr:DNA/RNA non-specific endonuclease [Actinorugispora endophytica]
MYEDVRWNGGHLVGTRFYGSGGRVNMVPMLETVNRNLRGGGPQRTFKDNSYLLERKWADALKDNPPKTVRIKIDNIFSGDSNSPDRIIVEYWTDGVTQGIEHYSNIPKTAPRTKG